MTVQHPLKVIFLITRRDVACNVSTAVYNKEKQRGSMSYPVLFSIVGAITGLVLSMIFAFRISITTWDIVLIFTLGLLSSSFVLMWGKLSTKNLIKVIGIMAIVLFGLAFWFLVHVDRSSQEVLFYYALIQITMIVTSFAQSWKSDNPHFSYADLFENAWNNHFFILFAGLLTGGFLLVLVLGTTLFNSIGIDVKELIWNVYVIPVLIGALVGAGVGISREHESLIFKIRSVFFAIFRIMAYLTAVIVLLFSASLPFSITTLFENRITSIILLSLVAVSILLLNTLVDKESKKLSPWANRLFSVQLVLLPFLALLSLYAISLRVHQYGLMPNRVIALGAASLLSIYTLTYAYQLIKHRGQWNLGLTKTNPALAMLWVVSLAAIVSPVLDPVRLSVNNQLARLESSHVSPDEFDFNTLTYRLGKRGKQAYKTIEAWTDHPQLAEIKAELAAIPNPETYRSKPIKKELAVTILGDETRSLTKLKNRYAKAYRCNIKMPCFIKKMKIETTSNEQAVMFYFDKNGTRSYRLNAEVYEEEGGLSGWWRKKQDFLAYPDPFGDKRKKELIKVLEQGELKLIQATYFDFEVDGIELRQ